MGYGSDFANWYDRNLINPDKTYGEQLIKRYRENPTVINLGATAGYYAASLAYTGTIKHYFVTIGDGVDVLKFGDERSTGDDMGYFYDAMRVVTVAGPVGRGIRFLARAGGLIKPAAKLVPTAAQARRDMYGLREFASHLPNCAWEATSAAGRASGHAVGMTVEHLAKLRGISPHATGGLTFKETLRLLDDAGIPYRKVFKTEKVNGLKQYLTDEQVFAELKRTGDRVAMLAVKRSGFSHSLTALIDEKGQRLFRDRDGRLWKTLDDVARVYRLDKFDISRFATVPNARVITGNDLVGLASGLPTVSAMLVRVKVSVERVFEPKKPEPIAPLKPLEPPQLPPGKLLSKPEEYCDWEGDLATVCRRYTGLYRVGAGDTIGKIALRQYGDANRYVDILRVNPGTIGPAPGYWIKPGQVIRLP